MVHAPDLAGTSSEYQVGVAHWVHGKGSSFEAAFKVIDDESDEARAAAAKGELQGGVTDACYLTVDEVIRALAARPPQKLRGAVGTSCC